MTMQKAKDSMQTYTVTIEYGEDDGCSVYNKTIPDMPFKAKVSLLEDLMQDVFQEGHLLKLDMHFK